MSTVRNILKSKKGDVVTIHSDATVLDAVLKMNRARIGGIVVMQGEDICGIFTERDVMNRVTAERRDPATMLVREAMTTKVAYCGPDTTIEECRTVMTEHRVRHLPVVEGDKLIGIISAGDLMALELKVKEETIKYLHDYMTGPN
jgi:CBS domain-containing protein